MDGGNGWFSWLKKVFISYSQCCATIVALRKHWHLSSCRIAILCTCLLLILEAGDFNSHENHPLPPSLSDDWKHRFGNKSNLMTFILIIYLAPFQGAYSEALPAQPRLNRDDFSCWQKAAILLRGSKRSSSGSPFQVEGPTIEGWAGPRDKKLPLGRGAKRPTGG